MTLTNFGRNIRFQPNHVFTPGNPSEVLDSLDRFRDQSIRAIGSLHSWSELVVSGGVVLDLRKLNTIELVTENDGNVYAEIEAGCTIDHALAYLYEHGGYTLPTYGMFGKQTLAGAIATATHGSGRESLSHHVSAIRVAGYDKDSGKARTYDWNRGDELLAARCGLGCIGIVLSVRIQVEPDYLIEEQTEWHDRIEPVLAQEQDYSRQQFYLIPWSWRWFAQLRRQLAPDSGANPTPNARFRRFLRLAGIDIAFNGALRVSSGTLQWWSAIQYMHRHVFPLIARSGTRIIDRSRHILMMRHDLFTHVEMELFVPAPLVTHAAAFIEWVLRSCGGESPPIPAILNQDGFDASVMKELEGLRGRYVHDHAITFRRVLRDDTLISMTSGDAVDAWYAISLITYQRNIAPFLSMAAFVARTMARAYGARPHWGKISPLKTAEIAALYPALPRFRACCESVDPDHGFVNDFARRVLGFQDLPTASKVAKA